MRRISIAFIISILLAGGAAFAGSSSEGRSAKGEHSAQKGEHSAQKGERSTQKAIAPAAVRHVKPQAPIVMGRSVGVPRKSKLHHVKVKPLEAAELSEDKPH